MQQRVAPAPTNDDVFDDAHSSPPPLPARKSAYTSSCVSPPSVQSQSSAEEVFSPESLGDQQQSLRRNLNQSNSKTLQPTVKPRNSKVSLPGPSSSVANAESSANVTSSDGTSAESSSKLTPLVSETPEEKSKPNVVYRRPLSTSVQNVKQPASASAEAATEGATLPPGTVKIPDGKPLPLTTKPPSRDSVSSIHNSPSEPAASEPTSTTATGSTTVTGTNGLPSDSTTPLMSVKERMKLFKNT